MAPHGGPRPPRGGPAARGLRVTHLRRRHREGFKAGALAAGLARARGSLLAVFDADFVPPPDFLRRTVPSFADPAVGMAQARWGHLNRRHSLLTRLQAALLDSHFLVEHRARAASGRFFNFNGTAGVWRRACIEDAGGWQADTLTEDLDLSYRAQLRGWRFVFLPEVIAPAELPVRFSAFRSQQHRWAKGSAQTALKILPRIWRAPLPGHVRLEAFLHLTGNAAYPLLAALALLLWPALEARRRLAPGPPTVLDVVLFGPAALSVAAFWVAGQRRAGRGWFESLMLVPALFAFGAALAVTNARAVFEAVLGRPSGFMRTPKSGSVDGGHPGEASGVGRRCGRRAGLASSSCCWRSGASPPASRRRVPGSGPGCPGRSCSRWDSAPPASRPGARRCAERCRRVGEPLRNRT